jgi:hypothetical protein
LLCLSLGWRFITCAKLQTRFPVAARPLMAQSRHAARTWHITRRFELSASGSFLVAQHRCCLFYL